MKQFKMILALLVWLGAVGCSQQEFSEEVVPETVEQQEETTIGTRVSKRLAVQRAKNAVKWISEGPQSRSDLLRVERVEVVGGSALSRADAADTLFYLVNFSDNQGYALVAADERNTDVYMMSDEGSLDLSELDPSSSLAYFMEQAEEYALYELDAFDRIPIDSMDRPVNKDDTISILFTEIYNGVEYHVRREYTTVTNGPKLCTQWHQRAPYNNKCFVGTQPAYAGCVAIAVAQIMAYHRHPTSYNWGAMLENAPYVYPWDAVGSDAVSTLVADVGDAVGMEYGVITDTGNDEGSSSTIAQAHLGLLLYLDYEVGDVVPYSYSIVQSNTLQNQPVFASGFDDDGNGHAWVIDGYQYELTTKYYYDMVTLELHHTMQVAEGATYVHNNWGLNISPTWTLSGVFDAYGTEFSTNNKIISYIKPRE